MVYFISGHRWLTQEQFDTYYVPAINKVLISDLDPLFVIGDYQGVDAMAQKYLYEHISANRITVYHMFEKPRNLYNEEIPTKGGYESDEERDAAMTNESDFDIAFVFTDKWSGTQTNINRRHNKWTK